MSSRWHKPQANQFIWRGINKQGQRVEGRDHANNQQQLRQQLLAQGIYLTQVSKSFFTFKISWSSKLKPKHIADFTYQLATLLQAGIELMAALTVLATETQHQQLKQLLIAIQQHIEQGKSLSQALQQQENLFDAVYISLVSAGEASGTLATLLQQVSLYQQRLLAIRQKVARAMFYPLMVAVVATIITIALLLFVVPQFQTVFASMGAHLPWPTQAIITLSQGLRHYGINISFSIILTVIIARYGLKRFKLSQPIWRKWLLYLPGIKQLIQLGNLTRLLRIVFTTITNGLPLIHALQLGKSALDQPYYQHAMSQTIEAIENGQSLQQALQQNALFTQRYRQMLAVAETTGDLTTMLQLLAQQSESQLDQLLDKLSNLIEPCMMLFLAAILGGLIIGMYLPIFKLGTVM